MRRITLWFLATLSTVVLLFGYRTSTSSTMATPVVAAAPGPAAAPTTTAATKVTGDTATTRWGPVQVQITVAGGKLTAVDVVQFPNGNGKDRQINAYAVPALVQETLTAQSANIDMISGATVTSNGYLTSLQSALDQAGIA